MTRTHYIVIGIVAVFILCVAAFAAFQQAGAEDRCAGAYRFLSSHINCATEEEQNTQIAKTEARVGEYVAAATDGKQAQRIGVFYRDLESRKWFGVNELEPFAPASLLKIPLVIAYFKLAEVDESILEREIPYALHPDVGPPVEAHLEDGASYPVRTLIEQVLLHSDNDATIALANNIREDYEQKVLYDLGVVAPRESVEYLSPKTYGAIFRALYNASYLQARYSEEMLGTMSRASFTEGLVAGVPAGTPVAHKFGFRNTANGTHELHDCGIIYHPDSPFILCVMTEGDDPETLKTVIADITSIIWKTL